MSVHDRWERTVVVEGRKTKVRTAAYGKGQRYEVRWRAGGVQEKRRFAQRNQADAFNAKQKVDPEERLAAAGRVLTVEAMMATWLATKSGRAAKTLDAYADDIGDIEKQFAGRLAKDLAPSEVEAWSGRDRGLSLRRRSLISLSGGYKVAIRDGLLVKNPCALVPRPTGQTRPAMYLDWDELATLAEAAGRWSAAVWLLGTAGLRIGECMGLQVGDVGSARVRVQRAVKLTRGGVKVGPPKGGVEREVPVPPFVLEMLQTKGRRRDEWLFTTSVGTMVRPDNWRDKTFRPTAKRAGFEGLHPHDLRHTAASLAIAAGADVLEVQQMLGHRSSATTHRIYLHLFQSRRDLVATRMQDARQAVLDAKRTAALTLVQGGA